MDDSLTLATCNFLVPEISEILSAGDYPDVKLISFSASCSGNNMAKDSIESIVKKNNLEHNDLVILSSICLGTKEKIETHSDITIITLQQCFEPLLNNKLLLHFIKEGYYLASNGWLRMLDQHIRNWGFKDKQSAHSFFTESMKGIMFLDTMIPGDYLPNLKALSNYMDLPYEILPVGLDNCKLYIDSIILKWRNEKERKSLNSRLSSVSRKGSDLMVIYNQLEILVNLTDEDKIIDVAFNLINILFAPQNIRYVKYLDGESIIKYYQNTPDVNTEPDEKNTFSIEIFHSNELFGMIEVSGIRFPQYMQQYGEMAKTVREILSISIANARKYSQILKQKDQIEIYSQELKKSNNTKDKFFSILAHDLKGPFNTLMGFSELLLDGLKSNSYERVEHFAQILNQNINETFDLLVNLLEWSRTQLEKIQYNPQVIDANEVIAEVRDLLVGQADRKKVFIKIDLPDELKIWADENMFKTIFRNLISNAIKFSNANGIIRISAIRKDNCVQMSVSDQGVGMDQETMDKLFKLNSNISTKGTSGEKGTGLGLLLCKEFMDAHNGTVSVKSEPENGSEFYMQFPLQSH